jgi:hypothetical protein
MGLLLPAAVKENGRTSKPPRSPFAETIKGPSIGSIVEIGSNLRQFMCKLLELDKFDCFRAKLGELDT